MVEVLIKTAGSLFIGGIGLALFTVSFLFLAVLVHEIYNHFKR